MRVILLKDVPDVGRKGEVKTVSDGYALNFLIPRRLAVAGAKVMIERVEQERKAMETEKKIQGDLLEKNLSALEGAVIEIQAKGNEQGHLFAGIHEEAIAAELKRQKGIDVLPGFIKLAKPVKETGEYTIEVEAGGKKKHFILNVKVQ